MVVNDVEILPEPLKSPSDRKSYRLIKLANGLKVLLVKNSEIKDDENFGKNNSAAVALVVDAGSFDDPKEFQGLSHFLEHMVFMGSSKYPKENEFDQFIKNRNGFDNAMTEVEHTIFYFRINDENLSGALDRFSQFFINPLMQIDSMEREIEAVESEFQNNIHNDTYRMAQIYASMALDNHRVGNFTWGNLKTLKHGIDSENLHKSLHDFRRRFYKSNHMKLCVQSSMNLDILQSIVVRYFGDIQPAYGSLIKDLSIDPFRDVFRPDFHRKIYFVKSTSKKRKLFMTFLLPPILDYRNKSLEYLAFLLNWEGRDSLISYLKRKSLALHILAKIGAHGFEGNSLFTFFTIEIGLTRDGIENIGSVLDAIFSFLLIIKMTPMDIHRDIFEEFREIKEILFKYRKEKQLLENVQELALNMLQFSKDEDVVVGREICDEFNEASMRNFIELINERRFNVMVLSDGHHHKYDKIEPWFGTQYSAEDFPIKFNRLWNERWIRKEFSLPTRNHFICKNFDLIAHDESFDVPRLIYKNEICKCFFKPDSKFALPHGFIFIEFISPLTQSSVENLNMTSIYSMCVKNFLSEKLYAATLVGYGYKLNANDNGLILRLNGFSEKLPLMLDRITKAIRNVDEVVDKLKFDAFKRDLRKNCYNFLINSNQFVEELRLHIVSSTHKFYFDRFKSVEKIDFITFKEFLINFLPSLRFKILIQGNFNTSHALEIKDILLKNLHFEKRNVQTKEIRSQTLKIPRGITYVKVKSLLPKDGNSIVKNFYQIDSDANVESSCLLELLVKILREPLFNTLRTREQLGYSVSCAAKNDNDIFGLSIIAESQEKRNSARLVDARIEKFLWDFFTTKLSEMCDDEFETMKRSIVNQRRSLDIDLESEVSRNWCEIRDKKYNFERNEIEARQLEILDKNALKIFFGEHILGAHRRKLSVQVLANIDDDDLLLQHGYVHLSLCGGDDEHNCVRDLAKFKQSLETFTR